MSQYCRAETLLINESVGPLHQNSASFWNVLHAGLKFPLNNWMVDRI